MIKNMEKIKEIGKKMIAQNNRATQYPLFLIQTKERTTTHEDFADDWAWLDEEGGELDKEKICDEHREGDEEMEPCAACGYSKSYPVKEDWQFDLRAGVFFTEEACKEHIRLNHYHYNEPRVYCIGAWRNDEMQSIMQHMCELAGKVPNFYK